MRHQFTALVDNGGVGWEYSKPREAFERTVQGYCSIKKMALFSFQRLALLYYEYTPA